MKNRQSAKERGLMKDIERERNMRLTASIRLSMVKAFVASDESAMTYQGIGQYRTALLKLLSDMGV
jgi:hypothetical protein